MTTQPIPATHEGETKVSAKQQLERVNIIPQDEPSALVPVTPMDMINRAVSSGADIEMIEKLLTLQERWEANQARKSFNEAFVAFKAEALTIYRNKLVTDGPLKGKKYAELFSFVDVVTPALSKHNLTSSWDITRDEKDWIEVTCIIEHMAGHSKRVSAGGPPDVGGAKNPLQARVSTITYLERTTLKAACGLAEQNDDNDGGRAAVDVTAITQAQVETIVELMDAVNADRPKFLTFFKIEKLSDLPAKRFDEAVNMLKAKQAK